MSTWHYSRNGQTAGPVTAEELKQLAATGQLQPADLIWKDGMADWVPASKLKGLFAAAAPAATPAAAAAIPSAPTPAVAPQVVAQQTEGSPISYFSSTSGLPPRVLVVLKGFPAATGERGDWPLSDLHMAQLKEAGKIRKTIRAAASLYKSLFALSLIFAVVFGLGILFSSLSGPSGGRGLGAVTAGIFTGVFGGITVLYYFCWRATHKCQRWAPLTMFILFMLNIAMLLFSIVMAMFNSRAGGAANGAYLVGPFIGIVLTGAFAATSWKAFAAIPQFLNMPLWAQEVLVDVGL